jgi:hypothetical protein
MTALAAYQHYFSCISVVIIHKIEHDKSAF